MAVNPTVASHSALDAMRRDWDDRARENARFYICTDVPPSDADFFASGEVDYNRFVHPFLERSSYDPNGRTVLEIGCGIGRMTRVFARKFGHVIGIDISAEMIEQARASEIQGAEFLLGSGTDLAGVRDSSVDFAFSYIVFQHIPDPRITLHYFSEIGRVLRPGGLFLIHVNGRFTFRLGSFVFEAYASESPKLQRVGLRKVPLLRRRRADTWMGHPISISNLRRVCSAADLRISNVTGRWTPETWVTGQKQDHNSSGSA